MCLSSLDITEAIARAAILPKLMASTILVIVRVCSEDVNFSYPSLEFTVLSQNWLMPLKAEIGFQLAERGH